VRTLANYVFVALCFVLWLCILQSLYYPFLSNSPELEWWQLGSMAGLGFVLGMPVHWLWESYLKGGRYAEQSFWLLSGVYSVVVYLLSSFAWKQITVARLKHGDT
jgi:hypothetical protein